MKEFQSKTIERERGSTYRSNKWAVYGHGVYERGSVLEGKPSRSFIDGGFETPEEAKAKYPDAEIIEGTTHIPISQMVAHLPDDDGSSEEADDYRDE